MSCIVGKTDTRAQWSVAIGVGAVTELIYIIKAVFGIIVIVGSVPNGGTTYSDTPSIVLTSNEEHVIQVAWVGHGVLLIFHTLVEYGRHFCGGCSGKTAMEHIYKLITVNA